jgi:hypothetical protein
LYGGSNPTFLQTISGYVNGEDATTAGISGSIGTASTTATVTSGGGTYTISPRQ